MGLNDVIEDGDYVPDGSSINQNMFYVGCVFAIAAYIPFMDLSDVLPADSGYISRDNIKFYTEDKDNNGRLESILEIKNIPYRLQWVDGKPVLNKY